MHQLIYYCHHHNRHYKRCIENMRYRGRVATLQEKTCGTFWENVAYGTWSMQVCCYNNLSFLYNVHIRCIYIYIYFPSLSTHVQMLQPCTFNVAAEFAASRTRHAIRDSAERCVATCGTCQAAMQAENATEENQIKNTPPHCTRTIWHNDNIPRISPSSPPNMKMLSTMKQWNSDYS